MPAAANATPKRTQRAPRATLAALLTLATLLTPATLAGPAPSAVAQTNNNDTGIIAVTPARLTDTRLNVATIDGIDQGSGKLAAGSVHAVRIGGRGGVPNDAAAAVVNITATATEGNGHLTIYPCDQDQPNVSTLNYATNDTIAAITITNLAPGGQTCIYSHAATHLIVDVSAYIGTDNAHTLTPSRVIDTRTDMLTAAQPLNAEETLRVSLPPSTWSNANAVTAFINVTAVDSDAQGHLTIHPCSTTKPAASNLNYLPDQTIANAATITINRGDQICVYALAKTHIVIDLITTVTHTALSPIQPIAAARLTDTRPDGDSIDHTNIRTGTIAARTITEIDVAGRADVPATATAAIVNTIAIAGSQAGHVTVYPCTPTPPNTSNVNYHPHQTRSNLTIVELSRTGTICVYNHTDIDLVVDVFAYQTTPTAPLAAAGTHTCTTTRTGRVECWGNNQTGQLGNGTTTNQPTPTPALGIYTARTVTTGGAHTCTVLSNATISCWGNNSHGELGNTTTIPSLIPTPVIGITNAAAVAAGDSHTCALHNNNTISCWGSNAVGQLGNTTTTDAATPTAVPGISGAISIAAAGDTTCAVGNDHTISCWGNNTYNQLGPTTRPYTTTPTPISGITNVTRIAVGYTHICATTNTTLYCWGNNSHGQLGNGTTTNTPTPTPVTAIDDVRHISAGSGTHSCATTPTTTYCWGNNSHGQTGQPPTTTPQTAPVAVDTGAERFIRISTADRHSCALDTTLDTYCWGDNNRGQLGNGTTLTTNTPQPTT